MKSALIPHPSPLPPFPISARSPKEQTKLRCSETLDVWHTPAGQRTRIWVLLILCGWMLWEAGSSEGLGRMPGLRGWEMEDTVGKCEQREAAIIQPSRMLSSCLVSPIDATTERNIFSASSGLTFRLVSDASVFYSLFRGKGFNCTQIGGTFRKKSLWKHLKIRKYYLLIIITYCAVMHKCRLYTYTLCSCVQHLTL